jgi:cell division protein FtsW
MTETTRQGHEARMATLILSALALAVIGVLIQISVDSPRAPIAFQRAMRQVIYVIAAAGLAFGAYWYGHKRALKLAPWGLYATWVLLAVLLIPGIRARGGAVRWIDLGPVNMQPSELAKLALVLFIPYFAERKGEAFATVRHGLIPALGYVSVTCALVLLEPDLGQTVLLLAISAVLMVINGAAIRNFMILIGLGIPLLVAFMGSRLEYVRDRIESFLGDGCYQVQQGLIFFASGGALGTGIGQGRSQLFVPEIHNDFALVTVAEQTGFFGALCVVGLFLALSWSGFRIALAAKDRCGFSIAFGATFMIALQACINISVVTGSIPPKGMSIPFLSFGGSSLLMLGLAIGLILSVARENALAAEPRTDNAALPEGAAA